MRDAMKPCQHSLSDDVYKEVVVIGNGPSGMVTSYMLAGNVPYLKEVPDDLPIDEMLKARLSNLKPGASLYEVDLMQLAEGLEGRSQNPIPLLMDNLLRPCADLGIQADPLIEWRHHADKQVDHVVLGRGPPGGAWHGFPPHVRTLSPAPWLTLPPKMAPATAAGARLPARAVADYCLRYVTANKIQRFFRSGVVVTSVTRLPDATGPPCHAQCPANAAYAVTGYSRSTRCAFRYVCRRVVAACGGGDRPNALDARLARHALHALAPIERGMHALANANRGNCAPPNPPTVLVVGSGVSAADAVRLARRAGLAVRHVHRAPNSALAKLDPIAYPDYCQVYKMMCDGPSGNHPGYTPYPEHIVLDVTPDPSTHDFANPMLRLKRVTLLNTLNNQTVEVAANLIAVLIGSRPDLFFLQTNFNLNCIDIKPCLKCDETKHAAKRKLLEEKENRQCFLRNHWHYLKSVLGQSIQSCKSRFNTEINGNNESEKCIEPDCNNREQRRACACLIKIDDEKDCKCDVVPFHQSISDPIESKVKCTCQSNPYSSGLGFGVDPSKPVDGRANPVAIDKSTHELLNAPKGVYALGPLTADNFIRFIPGGALAIVAHIHKERKSV